MAVILVLQIRIKQIITQAGFQLIENGAIPLRGRTPGAAKGLTLRLCRLGRENRWSDRQTHGEKQHYCLPGPAEVKLIPDAPASKAAERGLNKAGNHVQQNMRMATVQQAHVD